MGTYAAVAAVVLFAALVQGASGFGFSLVAVPLLALSAGPKDAVVLASVLAVLSTAGLAVRFRDQVDRPLALRLLGGACLGLPFGAFVLQVVPAQVLLLAIGVVVLVSTAVLARRSAGPGSATAAAPAADVGSGVLCGLLTTSVGTNGPPVVLRLQAHGLPAGRFRATASAVFVGCNLAAVALFAAAGRVDRSLLAQAAVAVPALVVGLWLGDRVHRRLPAERFRSLVLALMVLTAVAAVAAALR
ncbi:MAG: sulfite exporter TauE/SafE family protein [Actinomycetes bacterium]